MKLGSRRPITINAERSASVVVPYHKIFQISEPDNAKTLSQICQTRKRLALLQIYKEFFISQSPTSDANAAWTLCISVHSTPTHYLPPCRTRRRRHFAMGSALSPTQAGNMFSPPPHLSLPILMNKLHPRARPPPGRAFFVFET